MLSSSVVTNPRVPRLVRHSLNLESGLNDGLALPAVLAFAAALESTRGDFVWWKFVLQDVTLGLVYGWSSGADRVAADAARGLAAGIPAHQLALRARRRVRRLRRHGRAAPRQRLHRRVRRAITLGIRRPDMRQDVRARAPTDLVEVVKLAIFVVFGSLLTLDGLFADGWAAVAIVAVTLLVARPVARLRRARRDRDRHGHEGLHGLVRAQGRGDDDLLAARARRAIPGGERIFNLAALCVFVSIIAHGLTDHPGIRLDRSALGGGGR